MASEEPPVEGESGSSLLLNQPVVIDNGTSSLKAGFAGSSKPKVSSKTSQHIPILFLEFVVLSTSRPRFFFFFFSDDL